MILVWFPFPFWSLRIGMTWHIFVWHEVQSNCLWNKELLNKQQWEIQQQFFQHLSFFLSLLLLMIWSNIEAEAWYSIKHYHRKDIVQQWKEVQDWPIQTVPISWFPDLLDDIQFKTTIWKTKSYPEWLDIYMAYMTRKGQWMVKSKSYTWSFFLKNASFANMLPSAKL